jgi:RNA polymerase sigma factor (sigma-70 family)
MPGASVEIILQHLRKAVGRDDTGQLADGELLEQFVHGHDEAAFAELVRRHGPMVAKVCRGVLRHAQDAEDAFQATFLVLARKAASIRNQASVASWLHGVAHNVARNARSSAWRRRAHEERDLAMPAPDPLLDMTVRELQGVMSEELGRLPEKYRTALVLCYLEGQSQNEAARHLGCTKGVLRGLLHRGREQLRQRLARRGLALSAGLFGTALAADAAPVWAGLVKTTARAALLYAAGRPTDAAGIPTRAAALAEGVLKTMLATKCKTVTALFLVASLVVGAGACLHRTLAAQPPADPKPAAEAPRPREQPPAADEGKVRTVSGRVLGPDGQPLAGVKLYLTYATDKEFPPKVRATTGPDGRFRLTIAPAELDQSAVQDPWSSAQVVATAPGFGPDWADVGTRAVGGELTLRLVKDDVPILGRVLDLQGRPVAGTTVRLRDLSTAPEEDLTAFLQDLKADKEYPFNRLSKRLNRPEQAGLAAVTTDKDGQFRLTGCGRERLIYLQIEGLAIARQQLLVLPRPTVESKQVPGRQLYGARFVHAAPPGKTLVGTVREKGTGKPVPGVRIMTADGETRTDAKGEYRIAGVPKTDAYYVSARGPSHFLAGKQVADTTGFEPVRADFELERGLEVRCRLVDKATGQPVRGQFCYFAPRDNPHLREAPNFANTFAFVRDWTADDGTFSVVALPGRGFIAAQAHEDRYVRAELPQAKGRTSFSIEAAPSPLQPAEWHAVLAIEPSENDRKSPSCRIELDPGRTLTGEVHGPDGKPLTGATALGLTALGGLTYLQAPDVNLLKTAAFTATGLNPGRPRLLVFLHKEKNLAKAVLVRGDEPGPLTVRLEAVAAVTGRVLDAQGKPRGGLLLRADPSPSQAKELPSELALSGRGPVTSTALAWYNAVYRNQATTDAEGRFRLEGLVPGLRYSLSAITEQKFLGTVRADVAPSSEKLGDLGDLKVGR